MESIFVNSQSPTGFVPSGRQSAQGTVRRGPGRPRRDGKPPKTTGTKTKLVKPRLKGQPVIQRMDSYSYADFAPPSPSVGPSFVFRSDSTSSKTPEDSEFDRCVFCFMPKFSSLGQGEAVFYTPSSEMDPWNGAVDRDRSSPSSNDSRIQLLEPRDTLEDVGITRSANIRQVFTEKGECWAHEYCAAWAKGVTTGDGGNAVEGVPEAAYVAFGNLCNGCRRYGAAVPCQVCGQLYHYPCAMAHGGFLDLKSKLFLCHEHANDARTLAAASCVWCGEPGKVEELVVCTLCSRHMHGSCLDPPVNLHPALKAGWQCSDCKVCQHCRTEGDDSKMLVCDICDKGYHIYCIQPPLTSIPKNGWKCKNCRRCSDCNSRTPGSGPSSRWHLNYSVCDSCYQQRNKGLCCPVCGRAYRHFKQKSMVQCVQCRKHVHKECDPEAAMMEGQYTCRSCVQGGPYVLSPPPSSEDGEQLARMLKGEISGDFSGSESPLVDMMDESLSNWEFDMTLVNSFQQTMKQQETSVSTSTALVAFPFEKKSVGSVRGRKKKKPMLSSQHSTNSIVSTGSGDSVCRTSKFEDDHAIIIASSKNEFVFGQDMCVSCGSFGRDKEGQLISCAQCGQCYHLYCANIRLSIVLIRRGWRCLECILCEGCGKPDDEHCLLLCDDCDVSFHIYCLSPPLEHVPHGNWKCHWCVCCIICGAVTPGYGLKWQDQFTKCGICASLEVCLMCRTKYVENDLIIQCPTCARWFHTSCNGFSSEEMAERECEAGWKCNFCRPVGTPAFPSITYPGRVQQDSGREYLTDSVILSAAGYEAVQKSTEFVRASLAAANTSATNDQTPSQSPTPGDVGSQSANGKQNGGNGHMSILDVIESVTSANFEDDVKDEAVSENGSLSISGTADAGESGFPTKAPAKKTRRLSRVGVGGFSVRTNRQRTNSDKIAELPVGGGGGISAADMGLLTPKLEATEGSFDTLDEFDGNLISVGALTDKPPRRRRRPKQRGELEEVYPGYIQESFFGSPIVTSLGFGSQDCPKSPDLEDVTVCIEADFLKVPKESVLEAFHGFQRHSQDGEGLDELDECFPADLQHTDISGLLGMLFNEHGQTESSNRPGCSQTVKRLDTGSVEDEALKSFLGNAFGAELNDDMETVMLRASREAQEEQRTARKTNSRAEQLPTTGPSQVFTAEPPTNLPRSMLIMTGMPVMGSSNVDQRPPESIHGYVVTPPLGQAVQSMAQPLPMSETQQIQHHQQQQQRSVPQSAEWTDADPEDNIPGGSEPHSGTSSKSRLQKWEEDENNGARATISAVLYTNINHSHLRTQYPSWADRAKLITKIWKDLPDSERAPYLQKAKDNRAYHRQQLKKSAGDKQTASVTQPHENIVGPFHYTGPSMNSPAGFGPNGMDSLMCGSDRNTPQASPHYPPSTPGGHRSSTPGTPMSSCGGVMGDPQSASSPLANIHSPASFGHGIIPQSGQGNAHLSAAQSQPNLTGFQADFMKSVEKYQREQGLQAGVGQPTSQQQPVSHTGQPSLLEDLLEQERREQFQKHSGQGHPGNDQVRMGSNPILSSPRNVSPHAGYSNQNMMIPGTNGNGPFISPMPGQQRLPRMTSAMPQTSHQSITPSIRPPTAGGKPKGFLSPQQLDIPPNSQRDLQYEDFLSRTLYECQGVQKVLEDEQTKFKKAKKSLMSRQRQLKKSNQELNDIDKQHLIKLGQDIADQQKKVEQARKRTKQQENEVRNYQVKHGIPPSPSGEGQSNSSASAVGGFPLSPVGHQPTPPNLHSPVGGMPRVGAADSRYFAVPEGQPSTAQYFSNRAGSDGCVDLGPIGYATDAHRVPIAGQRCPPMFATTGGMEVQSTLLANAGSTYDSTALASGVLRRLSPMLSLDGVSRRPSLPVESSLRSPAESSDTNSFSPGTFFSPFDTASDASAPGKKGSKPDGTEKKKQQRKKKDKPEQPKQTKPSVPKAAVVKSKTSSLPAPMFELEVIDTVTQLLDAVSFELDGDTMSGSETLTAAATGKMPPGNPSLRKLLTAGSSGSVNLLRMQISIEDVVSEVVLKASEEYSGGGQVASPLSNCSFDFEYITNAVIGKSDGSTQKQSKTSAAAADGHAKKNSHQSSGAEPAKKRQRKSTKSAASASAKSKQHGGAGANAIVDDYQMFVDHLTSQLSRLPPVSLQEPPMGHESLVCPPVGTGTLPNTPAKSYVVAASEFGQALLTFMEDFYKGEFWKPRDLTLPVSVAKPSGSSQLPGQILPGKRSEFANEPVTDNVRTTRMKFELSDIVTKTSQTLPKSPDLALDTSLDSGPPSPQEFVSSSSPEPEEFTTGLFWGLRPSLPPDGHLSPNFRMVVPVPFRPVPPDPPVSPEPPFQPPRQNLKNECPAADNREVNVSLVLTEEASKNVQGVLSALAALLRIETPIQYEVQQIETPPSTPEKELKDSGKQPESLCPHCKVAVQESGAVRKKLSEVTAVPNSADTDDTVVFCTPACYVQFMLNNRSVLPSGESKDLAQMTANLSAARSDSFSVTGAAVFRQPVELSKEVYSRGVREQLMTVSSLARFLGKQHSTAHSVGCSREMMPLNMIINGDQRRSNQKRMQKWKLSLLTQRGQLKPPRPNPDILLSEMAITLTTTAEDTRICEFCATVGDGQTDISGRLLQLDANQWVHVNCALWSAEVFETQSGVLVNVSAAAQRAQHTFCSYCGRNGATLRCYRLNCPLNFHMPCAVDADCIFYKDKTLVCPDHVPDTLENILDDLSVFRKINIERDESRQIAKLFQQGHASNLSLRVGSLIYHNIGQLLPHQMASFHNHNFIYPVGYSVTRMYWSNLEVGKRERYNCSVVDRDGQPEFLIEYCRPNFQYTVHREANPKDSWNHVLITIEKQREMSGKLKLFSKYISGESLFGFEEQSVIKMIESLPGVESLLAYNFKFGRSPLIDLPLAVNPSGCARCEPRFRTNIKRPHTLNAHHSSPSCASNASNIWQALSMEMSLFPKQLAFSKWTQYRKMQQEWKSNVYLARSKIQGLGLYAAKDIDMNTMIIEYIGEVIRNEVAERREKLYQQQNRGIYMFRVDSDLVIDATVRGGSARYINHSCDPNCVAETVTFDKESKIVITSNRPISKGEELAYDYQFDYEDDQNKISCLCGAPNCKKWMN